MKITINDTEYKIKYTLRALFIFEQITGKSFNLETLLDNYIFFYSILVANNENVLTWDQFIDALDENPNILTEISKAVEMAQKKDELFTVKEGGEKKR